MPTAQESSDLSKIVLQNLHQNFRDDAELADVCFTFDVDDETSEKKFLPAHKLILAGGSTVFRAMFYGGLKEARDVPITDFSYDGFSEFINLFYLSDATLSKANILEVIRAIDKYDVRDCLPRCEQFLQNATDESNVFDVLDVAMKINLSAATTTKAGDVIRKNAANIFKSIGFLHCGANVLKEILQMDTLICANELAVFTAAMNWAGIRCREKDKFPTDMNKRTELGECFQLIRFAGMDPVQFLELNEQYPEVLSHQEFKEMLQHKLRGKPLRLFTEFNSTIRIFVEVEEDVESEMEEDQNEVYIKQLFSWSSARRSILSDGIIPRAPPAGVRSPARNVNSINSIRPHF